MEPDLQILRADDPRCAELEAAGYAMVAESWAACLVLADPPELRRLHAAVAAAERRGFDVREVGLGAAADLHELERSTFADYPHGPATTPRLRELEDFLDAMRSGARAFGAYDVGGPTLAGATMIQPVSGACETAFTSVRRGYRRRGLAGAVKAASIIAAAASGIRTFRTGGAAANHAILALNQALGYRVTERWHSYLRPPD